MKKKSLEQIQQEINRRNPTMVGRTGKGRIPRPTNPAKVYEIEKARRKAIGPNVGGVPVSQDVNPFLNPWEIREQKTFQQFVTEGRKKELRKALIATYIDAAKKILRFHPNQK